MPQEQAFCTLNTIFNSLWGRTELNSVAVLSFAYRKSACNIFQGGESLIRRDWVYYGDEHSGIIDVTKYSFEGDILHDQVLKAFGIDLVLPPTSFVYLATRVLMSDGSRIYEAPSCQPRASLRNREEAERIYTLRRSSRSNIQYRVVDIPPSINLDHMS